MGNKDDRRSVSNSTSLICLNDQFSEEIFVGVPLIEGEEAAKSFPQVRNDYPKFEWLRS